MALIGHQRHGHLVLRQSGGEFPSARGLGRGGAANGSQRSVAKQSVNSCWGQSMLHVMLVRHKTKSYGVWGLS